MVLNINMDPSIKIKENSLEDYIHKVLSEMNVEKEE